MECYHIFLSIESVYLKMCTQKDGSFIAIALIFPETTDYFSQYIVYCSISAMAAFKISLTNADMLLYP